MRKEKEDIEKNQERYAKEKEEMEKNQEILKKEKEEAIKEKEEALKEKEKFKIAYEKTIEEKNNITKEIENIKKNNNDNNNNDYEERLQKLLRQEKELNKKVEILQVLVQQKIAPKVALEMTIRNLRGAYNNGNYMQKAQKEFEKYIDDLEDWFNENKFNDEVDFEKKLNEVRYYLTNN